MKRISSIFIILLFICPLFPAHAQELPQLSEFLYTEGELQFSDYAYSTDYICNIWVFPRNSNTDGDVSRWLLQCIEEGFCVQKLDVDGYFAYRAEDTDGLYALVFPDYSSAVMLMVQQGMDYLPAEPASAPTSAPAEETINFPAAAGGTGHWEYVTVEKDCPSCYTGACTLCNGSGIYRMYGESVPCRVFCASCDGAGSYISTEMVYAYN